MFTVKALPDIPEINQGDDLSALITHSVKKIGGVQEGDIFAVSQKVVSKAEGRVIDLEHIQPSHGAVQLAQRVEKDARLVQIIMDESSEIIRAEQGRLICRTHHGFVCANAGVDHSNSGDRESGVLLPHDPDKSAMQIRSELIRELGANVGVLITDSFGRPWRVGQVDITLGCSGIKPVDDWEGRQDAYGKPLHSTAIAIADALAATADLARSKASREPIVLIRGLEQFVDHQEQSGAKSLLRDPTQDLFK